MPATASSAEPGNPQPSKGRVVPSGRLFSGSFTFSPRAAGASGGRGKGSLTLAVLPLLARLARRGRQTTSASEQDEHQRLLPAQNQTPTIQQTPQPPQVSAKSWVDGECVGQERRSQPPASWPMLNPAGGDRKTETVSGRGEYLNRATSSAGTIERTSARRESRLERTRLPRDVEPWLARNSKALDPESINRSKSARTSSGRCSRKPPHVDNHQSNQEATSHTPESMVSSEETCEADRETERFLASLVFSRVIEVTPGGTEHGPGKEEEEVR